MAVPLAVPLAVLAGEVFREVCLQVSRQDDSVSDVPAFGGHHRLDSLVVPVLDPEESCHVWVFPVDVHVQGGDSASGGLV